jgi:anti-sigma B factor antagonist
MNHQIEKNEHYVLITLEEKNFNAEVAAPFEKLIVQLYREGYSNMILDIESARKIDDDGLTLLKKITKVCRNEGGICIAVSKDDDILDAIDGAKIPELITLTTTDEAIDVVFMHDEGSSDFTEEDDDEYFSDLEGGGGGDDKY